MPRRRISRLFIRSTAMAMAALHSAREKNVWVAQAADDV